MFEAMIRVKSTYLKTSCLKTREKRENIAIKDILHKSPFKILLMPDIIYRILRISLVCGPVIKVRK